MSKYRRAARIDSNQNDIVSALRKLGVSVEPNHDDILCGHAGRTYWFELKAENVVSKKTGKVRESKKQSSQKVLEATWRGHYRIVSSLDEILKDMELVE